MEYIALIFSCIIGFTAIWYGFKFIKLYCRVTKWQRVDATILSKEMFIHAKSSTSRSPYGIKSNYRYQFNGAVYTGHRIYVVELINGQVNHMKSNAEKKLNSIKETMLIYVDPEDPKKAVIFCNGLGLYLLVLCIGIFSILLALSTTLHLLKNASL